jgi:effector-binding domain-containing protein
MCLFASAQVKNEKNSPKFEVKQIEAIKAIVIKASVPSSEIGKKMGELYGKLFGYLGQMQIQPSGAPFAVYYTFDPKGNTTFEVGVPINSEIKAEGDFIYKEFPAMKALTTLYVGSYEKLAQTYEAIDKYLKENNLQSTGICWEVYLTDPAKLKDPNENQTVIFFPLK